MEINPIKPKPRDRFVHRNIWKDQIHTVFSVTTENFIGTIKDAPPPIEIPCTRATCWKHYKLSSIYRRFHKLGKTIAHLLPLHNVFKRNNFKTVPGFSYRCEYDNKANTFYRPLQGKNPLSKWNSKTIIDFHVHAVA